MSESIPTITGDELIADFSLFFDWEERYKYLIELGSSLADFPDSQQTEQNRVQGCLSTVWLVSYTTPHDSGKLIFAADSDSQLVKGLVCILIMLYNNKTADEILQLDINDVFDQIQLRQHISRSRANGINSMIGRIKTLALEHATADDSR